LERETQVTAVLTQLNAVPGVVGAMMCDAQGKIVAHSFPPGFDENRLQQAAGTLADRAGGLEAAVGGVGTIDLRFANGRVVVRSVAGGRLLFLCAPTVNLQTLALSTSGAVRRLESLLDGAEAPPAPPRSGALHRLVQEIDAALERSGGDRYKLRGRIALMAGFALDLVDPESSDDPAQLKELRKAASVVLGRPF
jgi:predicted regulator of Ras-like GTPase activity (Roadblock/LC7/MglB family)